MEGLLILITVFGIPVFIGVILLLAVLMNVQLDRHIEKKMKEEVRKFIKETQESGKL